MYERKDLFPYRKGGDCMQYMDTFKKYYSEWFSRFDVKTLVEYEQSLSKFIDSDDFHDFPLSDEVLMMFELVRDECVMRCSVMADM